MVGGAVVAIYSGASRFGFTWAGARSRSRRGARKFRVRDAALPDHKVQSQLRSEIERNANELLAAFGIGRWRDLVAARNSTRNSLRQTI